MNELSWAAGLFEGEGCITLLAGGRQPALQLRMTDLDSVERFQRAVGVGSIIADRPTPGRKPSWLWRVSKFETAQAVMAMLYGGLGARRRARAREVFGESGAK